MPLLFVLIICSIVAAVTAHWGVAAIICGLSILAAGFIWGTGGFQPCPKCGSRLTQQFHDETPDFSHGRSIMHPYVEQKCWNLKCRKTTVLCGIVVESIPPNNTD